MPTWWTDEQWFNGPVQQLTQFSRTQQTKRLAAQQEAVVTPSSITAEDIRGMLEEALAGIESQQQTPAPVGPALPASEAEVAKFVNDHYGYMAAYLNHPEIGPILREAARKGLTDRNQLFGMLWRTSWWRSTSNAARQWDLTVNEDPASAQAMRDQRAATVGDEAKMLGLSLSGQQLGSVVEQSLRNGWSPGQITDYLVSLAPKSRFTEGMLGAYANQVKALASTYLVSVSDSSAASYARRIAAGETSLEGLQAVFANQARSRFTWMADVIDQGVTPMEYLAPVRETIAQELERPVDSVNLMSPEWLGLVEVRDPSGQVRAATQEEARLAARKRPEWQNTQNATEMMANLGNALASFMGVRR